MRTPRSSRSPLVVSSRPLLGLALVFLVSVGAGSGCGTSRSGAAHEPSPTPTNSVDPKPTPTPGDPALITKSGTVRHLDLEGGFWGIVADDSTQYDPGALDDRFQVDGLRVRFDARLNAGQMSIRQWGKLVTIVRIDKL